VGANKICSNRESGEDEYSSCKSTIVVGRVYIVRHYRNQRFVAQGKRIEYRDNCNIDNLKEKENLAVLD